MDATYATEATHPIETANGNKVPGAPVSYNLQFFLLIQKFFASFDALSFCDDESRRE